VVVGEAPYAEMFGDNLNLTIPLGGGDTIKNVCGSLKCLVILISGRPLVIEPYLPLVDAFVAAWLPGTEGQGVTDVIFGDYGFQGKLPRTWFKSVDQLPMNVGTSTMIPRLFPLGFGLTNRYTSFCLSYIFLVTSAVDVLHVNFANGEMVNMCHLRGDRDSNWTVLMFIHRISFYFLYWYEW
jgi:hypothetical protein